MQEPQQSQIHKDRGSVIEAKQKIIAYCEELAYCVKDHARPLLIEINSRINDYQNDLISIVLSPENGSELSEDQLKKIYEKTVRKQELELLKAGFNFDYLMKLVEEEKEKLENLIKGEPLEVSY